MNFVQQRIMVICLVLSINSVMSAAIPPLAEKQKLNSDAVKNVAQHNLGLIAAASGGDVEKVKALLAVGTDVNQQDEDGSTPLMYAAAFNYLDIVKQLLAKGARPDIKNAGGGTPLTMAAFCGHQKVVKQLLVHGADPVIEGVGGETPLMMAAYLGHQKVVKQLLVHGAEPVIKGVMGIAAFFAAATKGHVAVAELLSDTLYKSRESLKIPEKSCFLTFTQNDSIPNAVTIWAFKKSITCYYKTQVRYYLKALGARHRKVCGVPAKADGERQQEFLDTELQPRLDEAEAGKRTVFFVDAAHFVLGAFLGFLWSLRRVFTKTPSGRQRFNVLGALNAITKELITVTNDTYITSTQVCELLVLTAQRAPGPVTIVLDNARYQRCKAVTELAEKLKIDLLFLPPYSPNLNLIERVWKFTKKRCLNSRYYPNFELFRNAICSFLANMHDTHATELSTLLTLKFQIFTKDQVCRAV